jgi:hypothetical protein
MPETVTRCCILLRRFHVPKRPVCLFPAIEYQADSNPHCYLASPKRLGCMAEHRVIGARREKISDAVILTRVKQ